MTKHLAIYVYSILFLILLTSSLMAAGVSGPEALKWTFDVQGRATAAPTIATDGKVYVSTVDVDAESKEKRYYVRSLTPGQGGSAATENWSYPFFIAAVTTSPALSLDEKVIYTTSNASYAYSSEYVYVTQLTALDYSTGKPTAAFNKGGAKMLFVSKIGAPKVDPVTGNIIVNTLDKIHDNYLQQNLRIYHENGTEAFTTYLSKFDNHEAPLVGPRWLDFEHQEPVLNGRGGAAQIVINSLSRSSRFCIADYRHEDAQSAAWPSWTSERVYYESSVPHLAMDAINQRFYFVNEGDLYAYKENNEYGLWAKHLTPDVTLAAVAPTIATPDPDTADAKSAFAKAGTLYLGGMNGHVYGINPSDITATLLFDWSVSSNALNKRMVIDNINDILYVADTKGALFALDLRAETSEAAILWQVKNAHINTAPVVAPDGSVVVGSSDNRVKAYVGGRGKA